MRRERLTEVVEKNRCAARSRPPPVTGTPDDVELEFYDALQRGDIERLMAVWSDDDEIVCVHPGGIAPDRRARRSARPSTRCSPMARIAAEPHHVRRLESHAVAVHSVLERIRIPDSGHDGERFAWVAATNVYLKSMQGWRMVAHHASPGTAAEAQDGGEAGAILH